MSTGLEALLCLKLLATGAWRVYPRFMLFVGSLSCESIALAITVRYDNDLYGTVWLFTRAVVLALEILAVVEIFSRASENFPGIESIGRKLFLTLFSGGLLIAIATSRFDRRWGGWRLATNVMFVVTRETHLWLGAFLIFTLGFFAFYAASVPPNLRRHAWSMFALLATTASTYLVTARVHNIQVTNILLQVISLTCLVSWLFAFRPGEDRRRTVVFSEHDFREMSAAEALNERLVVLSDRITLRSLLGLAPKARPSGD